MGNRTFLSVSNAATDSIAYEHVAFETNNFLAPIWFCLVSQEQFQRYSDQVMQAWNNIQSFADHPNVEELPEWVAFSEAFQWQITWSDAAKQLCQNIPRTLAFFPSLADPVYEWLKTLSTHVERYSTPVIHLELSQYSSFYDDPVNYLRDIQTIVTLWQSPHRSHEKIWQEAAEDIYMLYGEQLPWVDQKVTDQEQVLEAQSVPPNPSVTRKSRPKGLEELYYWLLAILAAAVFFIVTYFTKSIWIGALAFVSPLIVIILINLPKRMKPASVLNKKDNIASFSNHVLNIEYFDGKSPIGAEGLAIDWLEGESISWKQILQVKELSSHEIEVVISAENEPITNKRIVLKLEEQLLARDIVLSIYAIRLVQKMAV
ncbi:hypothetical protein ACFSTH_17685 [Paenibacillus yanchengensis]|uniref:Uncharacterized protein n=1 Tax=Paenibacillus yanchengensis TaxID=2035833 RepID=A0ABW4YQL9_9BACL